MSSSSSVFPELSSLVWFSLLVCTEVSLFGVQLPWLLRNFDRFVSIRRFCRILCGCFKKQTHTEEQGEVRGKPQSDLHCQTVCGAPGPVLRLWDRCPKVSLLPRLRVLFLAYICVLSCQLWLTWL